MWAFVPEHAYLRAPRRGSDGVPYVEAEVVVQLPIFNLRTAAMYFANFCEGQVGKHGHAAAHREVFELRAPESEPVSGGLSFNHITTGRQCAVGAIQREDSH